MSSVLKSNCGEPDAILVEEVPGRYVRPYVKFDLELGSSIIEEFGKEHFLVWLACWNAYKVRGKRAFKLNKSIRKKWSIPDKSLTIKLQRLRKSGVIKYLLSKGKSPEIIWVKES